VKLYAVSGIRIAELGIAWMRVALQRETGIIALGWIIAFGGDERYG
jgi:hypothetical protein